nr:reverse transcriptase domain-containing protein [Tanacetum cinerariifolium]
MRARSSSNLPVVSLLNPSTSNPKRRNRRHLKQPLILEESPIDTMADQRTMVELLCAPTEGYAEAIVVPPILAEQFELKHSLINMMNSDQFFRLEKDNPQDHIRWFNKIASTIKYKHVPNSAIKLMLFPFSLVGAARRWLEKEPPHSIHTWEDLVSKFINEFFLLSRTTNLLNQQTSAVTTAMTAILKQFQATHLQLLKAVEEICVTCGGAHPYYQCMANQIRPPGFAQPDVQNNQNRFSQPQRYNRGNNFNQEQSYQAPTQQNQIVPLNELEKVKRINEANMKAMQTQINIVKNELRNEMKNLIQASMSNQTNEIKNMMASLFQMSTASTSGSGSLPSNTVANPKGKLNPSPLEVVLFLMDLSFLLLPYSLIRSELKCKALADLGASINLMPLSVWKKL